MDPKLDDVAYRRFVFDVLRLQVKLDLRAEARATWAVLKPLAGAQSAKLVSRNRWLEEGE